MIYCLADQKVHVCSGVREGSLVWCQTGGGTCESKCECFVIKTEVIIGLFFRSSRFLRIVSLSSSFRLFCALMCSKWRCVRYPSPHCIGLHKPVAVRFGTHPSTLQAPLSTTLTSRSVTGKYVNSGVCVLSLRVSHTACPLTSSPCNHLNPYPYTGFTPFVQPRSPTSACCGRQVVMH